MPSVRSAVTTPVLLETARIWSPISLVLAATSVSVPVSRVEILASCTLYSDAALTAATPMVPTVAAAATAAPAITFPAFLAEVPRLAKFLSAAAHADRRLLSVLPPIFSISSYILLLANLFHLLHVGVQSVRDLV